MTGQGAGPGGSSTAFPAGAEIRVIERGGRERDRKREREGLGRAG